MAGSMTVVPRLTRVESGWSLSLYFLFSGTIFAYGQTGSGKVSFWMDEA